MTLIELDEMPIAWSPKIGENGKCPDEFRYVFMQMNRKRHIQIARGLGVDYMNGPSDERQKVRPHIWKIKQLKWEAWKHDCRVIDLEHEIMESKQ